MGNDQGSLTRFKIESLRLGFPFGKPSLRDSILMAYAVSLTSFKIESLRLGFLKGKPSLKDSSFLADVASTWSTCGNRVSETQFPRECQVALSHIRTRKPSLKGSICKPKIEPLRLEMLLTDIVSELAY